MNTPQRIAAIAGLAAVLASGSAMARGQDEIQWSVTIGTPVGVPVYTQPVPVYTTPTPVYTTPTPVYTSPVPVYTRPAPVYGAPLPVYREGRHGRDHGYGARPTRWDRDGDGIPNRRDRVYNPPWDRDGDGIPNRHDRVYNPRWDRDGDGVPNWQDRRDGGRGWGR